MNKKIVFAVVMLLTALHGFAQDVGLARSSPDYMVTPGDVYTLTFSAGGNIVAHTIVVGADYRIRVLNLGVVNGRGRTFAQIRNEVEAVVSNNHPLSGPQLIITQPAVFRVFVSGEVYSAGDRSAWGLTRLSSLVDENLTRMASTRNVSVRSANGQTRVFDLFQFWRFGNQAQNPHLRPGDVVTFNRVHRLVTIQGEVERPGTYQMLPGENLRQLIELYGNNLTPMADLSRITLTRFVGGEEISGSIIPLSAENITGNFALEHLDIISIPSIADFRPAVPVERRERTITITGAVRRPGVFELMPTENLRELIEVYGDGLTPLADLSRMTLTRFVGGEEISGDIIILTEEDIAGNLALQHMDVISIPSITDFRPVVPVERVERTITISGAVRQPGTFELMPNENLWELIEVYGEGLTPLADLSRMRLTRFVGGREISGDIILFSTEDIENNLALEHLDVILIPDITDFRPAVPIERVERTITITGAVRRPGTFELLQNENLRELIEVYGDGLTPLADLSRITLTRFVGGREISGDRILLSEEDIEGNFALHHLDVITIPDITEFRPVVPVERVERMITITGAVRRPGTFELMQHENLRELIEVYGDGLTPLADLSRITLTRFVGGREISGDRILLSEEDIEGNFALHHLDVITIPDITEFRPVVPVERVERMITITGAVRRPGTFELMQHENLRELIEVYGDGLTPLADLSRITLTRFVGGREISGDRILLSEGDIANNFALHHLDVITIPDITDFRPVVTVERVERTITIIGAVRRPGTFELMQNEHLLELIGVYGDGLTPLADPTRIEIVRRINSEDLAGNRLFLSLDDLYGNFALEHYDMVIIPSVSDLLPVVFVEGAVGIDITAALVTTNRVSEQFFSGETYASLVRRNRGWFSAVSDLEFAYVIRASGEIIPLNLNLALFDVTYRGEVLVENLDTLIIPFRQFFVTVAGAVMAPGRFPFIPDRSWEYYVALAGGFAPGRNTRNSVIITDMHGRRLRPTDPITPETVITARTNHPMFLLSQYVVPVLSIVTTLLTAFLLVSR